MITCVTENTPINYENICDVNSNKIFIYNIRFHMKITK